MNVGDRLAKKNFQWIAALLPKKRFKKTSFVSDGHFREGSLNFNLSLTSIKSHHGDIISFPN